MSEPTRTLWFEDVGFLNEPMLDTPVGRLSIHQTIAVLVFGVLGWFTSFFFQDLVFKVAVGGGVFFAGAFLFTRRVKTVSPERHLLLMLGIGRSSKKRARKGIRKKGGRGRYAESTVPVKPMVVSASLDMPVKVVGVLRDPASGKLLPRRGFEINIGGKPHSAGITDEHGFFNVLFVPDHFGLFKVEVKPEGFADVVQQITVNVTPKGVGRIVPG